MQNSLRLPEISGSVTERMVISMVFIFWGYSILFMLSVIISKVLYIDNVSCKTPPWRRYSVIIVLSP